MSNLLKNIFSNESFMVDGQLSFENAEDKDKFIKALETVYNEGKTVRIDATGKVTEKLKTAEFTQSLIEDVDVNGLTVGPCQEETLIKIFTPDGQKKVSLSCVRTTSKDTYENGKNDVIHIKATFLKNEKALTFSCRMQIGHAQNIEDISNGLHITIGIFYAFKKQYNLDEKQFCDFVESFLRASIFTDQLITLQNVLKTKFPVSSFNDSLENRDAVHTLYLLLIEKKAVRVEKNDKAPCSATITASDGTFNDSPGTPIDLTYTGNAVYTVCKEKVHIYTAVLLTNAVIIDVTNDENGKTILYGDSDSKPMYIAFKGFLSAEDAQAEAKLLFEHRDEYAYAQTIGENISNWIENQKKYYIEDKPK